MLSPDYGKKILNGLLSTSRYNDQDGISQGNDVQISFGSKVYLGLLTELPTLNEGSWGGFTEPPAEQNYIRVQIDTKNYVTEEYFLSPAKTSTVPQEIEGEGGAQGYVTSITNKFQIMFRSANIPNQDDGTPGEPWIIKGFGLFSEKTGDTLPFLWGDFGEDEEGEPLTVTIENENVPIVRVGGFTVSLV